MTTEMTSAAQEESAPRLLSEVLDTFMAAHVVAERSGHLAQPGVVFSVSRDTTRGTRLADRKDTYEATAFHYVCSFARYRDGEVERSLTAEYSKGHGHYPPLAKAVRGEYGRCDDTAALALMRTGEGMPFAVSREFNRGHAKCTPTAREVLHSLLMDAVDAHENPFSDWCANLGYSDDSIKAKAVYDLCADRWHQLSAVFGYAAFAQLVDDYQNAENDI